MLRDATLQTFLELCDRGQIKYKFNKQEMTAELPGGRTIFFRSGDRPDTLRGPNLGWYYLDEAAMMAEKVNLIMMGRLRRYPARGWGTTTTRGKNWVWKTFVDTVNPNYAYVKASSWSNPYLPHDFVQSLVDAYDSEFARQEIDGDFLDDTLGQLILDWWVDRLPELRRPNEPGGSRWISTDLGEGGGRDSSVSLVGDDLGILHGEESPWVGPAQSASIINDLRRHWDVREDRIIYDAGGGRGLDIRPYLEQFGITEAVPYKGSKSGGDKFLNRRSKMGWKLRQRLDPERPKPPPELYFDAERAKSAFYVPPAPRPAEIQMPFCLPEHKPWWPLLSEELKNLKWFHKGKLIALEPKEELQKRIRRSPNVCDALMMSRMFDEAA